MPDAKDRKGLARDAYRAYASGERKFYDDHLATDLVFFSPAIRGSTETAISSAAGRTTAA